MIWSTCLYAVMFAVATAPAAPCRLPWSYAVVIMIITPVPESAPARYLRTPPTLTWVSLGTIGHMFGLSNERVSLEHARAACKQQVGTGCFFGLLDVLLVDRIVKEECAKCRSDWRALTKQESVGFGRNPRILWTDALERRKTAAATEKSSATVP